MKKRDNKKVWVVGLVVVLLLVVVAFNNIGGGSIKPLGNSGPSNTDQTIPSYEDDEPQWSIP